MQYRRDWFLYEYARDQLKLAGFDPYGPRPTEIPPFVHPKKKVKSQEPEPQKANPKKASAKPAKAKKAKAKKANPKKVN